MLVENLSWSNNIKVLRPENLAVEPQLGDLSQLFITSFQKILDHNL